ncbi:hypothetical protein GCM10007290_38330 [Providencia stuartii]|nr:hypothetical protein GCM10007290_38330 [Providencia thailandensis]
MSFSFQMPTNVKAACISYASICIAVIFYFLEIGYQLFFTLYKPGSNFGYLLFAYHKSMSFYFLGYLVILAPIFILHLKNNLNFIYRVLIYFIIPSIFSMVLWYFNVYLQLPITINRLVNSRLDAIIYFISQSYLVGMTFIITIVASISDFILTKLFNK